MGRARSAHLRWRIVRRHRRPCAEARMGRADGSGLGRSRGLQLPSHATRGLPVPREDEHQLCGQRRARGAARGEGRLGAEALSTAMRRAAG
eukprot:4966173-Pyramimonas_sp.AAC.1